MSDLFQFPQPIPDSVARLVLPHRIHEASAMFGHNTQATQATLLSKEPISRTGTPQQQAMQWGISIMLVVLTIGLYFFFMRFAGEIRLMFKNIISIERTLSVKNSYNSEFVKLRPFVGTLYSLILTVSIVYTLQYYDLMSITSTWFSGLWWGVKFLVILSLILGMWIYQACGMAICRWASGHMPFYDDVQFLMQYWMLFIFSSVVPLSMVFMLIGISPIWIFMTYVGVMTIYFIRIYGFFRRNGFAPLQWFLYLCTIQILPISTILLFGR